MSCDTWDSISINDHVLRGIYAYGFETPSPIQKLGITHIIQGSNLIAQAQSGTGKTGCFAVGVLHNIDPELNQLQAIIIAPTRELAVQIQTVFLNIGKFIRNLNIQLLVGGDSLTMNLNDIQNKTPHIIIGCIGRINDVIRRNGFLGKTVKTLIVDEADEILSDGFKEQFFDTLYLIKEKVQICLFSATFNSDHNNIINNIMNDPVKILVKSDMLTLEGIAQYYIALDNDAYKYETLKDIYNSISLSQSIIYCNSIYRVNQLYKAMVKDDFPVIAIHSGLTKHERNDAYKSFKSGVFRVLISSDITCRGIDIQQVSTVINFDIPVNINTYLHRIGRSGRWGRKGVGINFVTKTDIRIVRDIEKHFNTEIKPLPQQW
jgi:superfamily II DNA/RNA helicase